VKTHRERAVCGRPQMWHIKCVRSGVLPAPWKPNAPHICHRPFNKFALAARMQGCCQTTGWPSFGVAPAPIQHAHSIPNKNTVRCWAISARWAFTAIIYKGFLGSQRLPLEMRSVHFNSWLVKFGRNVYKCIWAIKVIIWWGGPFNFFELNLISNWWTSRHH
jgi:hypothetical protein